MYLERQSVTLVEPLSSYNDIVRKIEYCGKVCYKSEPKHEFNGAEEFIRRIIKNDHTSQLEHHSITVEFNTDRGITHELVRHRLASFSQTSTRYCNYSKDKFDNQLTFIIPNTLTDVLEPGHYVKKKSNIFYSEYLNKTINRRITRRALVNDFPSNLYLPSPFRWLNACERVERDYMALVTEDGWKPEDARSVLPTCTQATLIVI